MQDFRKINFWQRAYNFSLRIYKETQTFPAEEKYGLTSQLRRASSSIPINIAEGAGRNSNKEFANFLQISMGSASEVECELMFAKDLGYLNLDVYYVLAKELKQIRKMIYAYREAISINDVD